MSLVLFDFDGTITKKDSLLDFIIAVYGRSKFVQGILMSLPILLAWKFGFNTAKKAKEKLITRFFGGVGLDEVEAKGRDYLIRLDKIVSGVAMRKIAWHQSQNHKIVVVSASSELWLKPWCEQHKLQLICTRWEVIDGKITGRIDGENCSGEEKVRRIKEHYDLGEYSSIYAYGNSKGDLPMLKLANEKFYKCF